MKDLIGLLPLIGIALIFWLLVIRPGMRRQKEMVALQAALSVGDDVITTSGIFGTITASYDDSVELEVAPGVSIRVVRAAVGSVRRDVASDAADEPDAENLTGEES